MTLPSGVICGVTSSFRLALRNCTAVAPLEVAVLVRQLFALLDQRLDLVGRDHARAGDDLALAVCFERRQLEVQESIAVRTEQGQRKGGRHLSRSTSESAGRLTKLRVADELTPAAASARRQRSGCRRRDVVAAADWLARHHRRERRAGRSSRA